MTDDPGPEISGNNIADEIEDEMQFAWVIEHAESEGSRPRYYDGVGWSDPGDHAAAIRFAREADANRMNSVLDPPNLHHVREHGWDGDVRVGTRRPQ